MKNKTKLMLGDNIESLKKLPANSIDSVVTDGPYGLTFMNKKWDYDVPSVEFWKEVYRVLKPGGHVLSFGGTRTYHRMVVNIEDAGFEIRDQIMWIYGSGFPKSYNIGKSIQNINEKGSASNNGSGDSSKGSSGYTKMIVEQGARQSEGNKYNTKMIIDNEWEGFGTALKPANEPICLARKPLSEKSVAENVLKWRTGGINVDGCRVGYTSEADKESAKPGSLNATGENSMFGLKSGNQQNSEGRFPANIIFDEEAAELLDEQSGGASRFFYQAKVSKAERNMGLEGFEEKGKGWSNYLPSTTNGTSDVIYERSTTTKNTHPTVKPINLMAYLCRLITPPNGIVLDTFMGSGSTGIAAQLEGFRFVGMEMDEDYFKIAEARIENFEKYKKFTK
jgi:site-specific DNA-methyltransferase (adenine-specific)